MQNSFSMPYRRLRRRNYGQGKRPSGQSNTTIKITATTTKVSATAVVVDHIGCRIKVKARLLTGLLIGEPTAM
jgi:hypothetical protein